MVCEHCGNVIETYEIDKRDLDALNDRVRADERLIKQLREGLRLIMQHAEYNRKRIQRKAPHL